jgi:hypothetical protein
MNDFTYDELEELSTCIADYTSECQKGYYDMIYPELYSKVQSMITDYCSINGHAYEFSLGPGYCENCRIHENEAYRLEQELKNE